MLIDAVGEPALVVLQRVGETRSMEAQGVLEVLHGVAVRTMKIHRLQLEDPEASHTHGPVVDSGEFDERQYGGLVMSRSML